MAEFVISEGLKLQLEKLEDKTWEVFLQGGLKKLLFHGEYVDALAKYNNYKKHYEEQLKEIGR